MPSLSPDPGFEYYYKAIRKGDSEGKAIAVGESPSRVPADVKRDHWATTRLLRDSRDFEGGVLPVLRAVIACFKLE